MAETPSGLVQRQVEAYNARDLQRFVATFADDVEVYRLPSLEPTISGKAALAEFYSTQRFNKPGLRAEIVNRIAMGSKVIDHERVWGIQEQPLEVAAVYQVSGGLIRKVWFFAPD